MPTPSPEARRTIEAMFCALLARQHPGTRWHIEDEDESADELPRAA
jgi:hypothetical protein